MKKYELCIVEFELGKNPRLTTWSALRTEREFPIINSSIGAYQFINDMSSEGWLVQHVETDFSGSASVFMTVWLQREIETVIAYSGLHGPYRIEIDSNQIENAILRDLPTRFEDE